MPSWIPIFKRHFTDKEILSENYLIALLGSTKTCKVCGPFNGNTEEHIAIHATQIEEYNKSRKVEAEEKKKATKAQREAEKVSLPTITDSEFYAVPCSVCSKGIKRSGKRGRPPTRHEGCKA